MKKLCILILISIFISTFLTACTQKKAQKPNMIQSKRRFANYIEGSQTKDPYAIDLSEGQKIKYDKKLGPQNPDFDFKIVDPYKY